MPIGVYHRTEEARRNIGLAQLGKHHSNETKKRMRMAHLGKILSEEHKKKIGYAQRGKHYSEETKKKISLAFKGKPLLEETKRKMSESHRGNRISKETKIKISKKQKLIWQNKEYSETQHKLLLKSLFKRPTSLEKRMIEIIHRCNLPYRYTGDGDVILGGKNPDFVNNDGKKICIDVRHTAICENIHKQTFEEYKKQREEHFAKYEWECLVFSEKDLEDEESIIKKMR